MKKSSRYVLSIFIYCIVGIFFLALISSPISSSWWVKNVAIYYHNIIGFITNIFPFAFFEIVVLLLVILLIIRLVQLFKAIMMKNMALIFKKIYKIITFALNLLFIYTAIAGVAYYREAIPLPSYEGKMTQELVTEALDYYLNDYNSLSKKFERTAKNVSRCPYTFNQLSSLMQKEMKRLDDNQYFTKHNAKAKGSWISPLLSELQITGINFAFTSEANVNTAMPWIDLPFTIAHEIAHMKGVLRENDANLTALYICVTSQDDYVRYSGYFRGFYSLLEIKQLTNSNEYLHYINNLSPEIIYDNRDYVDYFNDHDLLSKLSYYINNIYLKVFGQKDGMGSYDDKSDVEDTNQKDENGFPIYTYINYSPYQKLLVQLFLNKNV